MRRTVLQSLLLLRPSSLLLFPSIEILLLLHLFLKQTELNLFLEIILVLSVSDFLVERFQLCPLRPLLLLLQVKKISLHLDLSFLAEP